MSHLYEALNIDPEDVVEQQCGMKHCTGPALADIEEWLNVEATATKDGEGVVGRADARVPLCPPHALVWYVLMDTLPEDMLVFMLADLVDLEQYPLGRKLGEDIAARNGDG